MASVQQAAQGVAQINHDKEKAIVSELVKEAQTLLEKNRDAAQPQLATVGGITRNSQGRLLKLAKIHHGFGNFVVQPSESIGKDVVGSFVHSAQSIQIPEDPVVVGSKAAVIYSTIDLAYPPLGYLLAWYKAQSSSEHKVYVLTGNPSNLLKLEWAEIERKLDESGNKSHHFDVETGAYAAAEIHNFNVGGNLAGLGANFTRVFIPISN